MSKSYLVAGLMWVTTRWHWTMRRLCCITLACTKGTLLLTPVCPAICLQERLVTLRYSASTSFIPDACSVPLSRHVSRRYHSSSSNHESIKCHLIHLTQSCGRQYHAVLIVIVTLRGEYLGTNPSVAAMTTGAPKLLLPWGRRVPM